MAGPHEDLLGLTVRDVVTGFEGMVTSQTRYLAGCDRVEVTPTVDKNGKLREKGWCDVLVLEVVKDGPVYRPPVVPYVGG